MIKPKSFGKKYFTLSYIHAHLYAAKLHGRLASMYLFFVKTNKDKESSDKDDPPLEYESLIEYPNYNFFFSKCTKKISKLKKVFCEFCNYSYYGFCRSGIHPPKNFFNSIFKTKS
ncbi:MAG: hypothetical protein LBD84_07560 [Campylobacteraceae bacterium]|nr:hypothetical protein [Campylobacteraceae bacterium]